MSNKKQEVKKQNRSGKGKYIISCIVISLGLIFVIPFVVNWLFSLSAPCELFEAKWFEADALSYGGAVLSFIGTVVLGAVAVFQTGKANEQTEIANQLAKDAITQTQKANELAAQMQRIEQAKLFSMVSVDMVKTGRYVIADSNRHDVEMKNPEVFDMVNVEEWPCSHCYHVGIRFKNESCYPILKIYAHAGDYGGNESLKYALKDIDGEIYIAPQGTLDIRFILPATIFEKYKKYGVKIKVSFMNVFDYKTDATILIDNMAQNGTVKEYSYQIGKLIDVTPQCL